jgi:microcystin-dependent protein
MSRYRAARLLISLALAALLSGVAAVGLAWAAGGAMVGEIRIYAGQTPPNGWMLADGRELTRSLYPALFDVLSVTYGSLTTETFNLPDLSARVAVGTGLLSGTNFLIGAKGGEISHALVVAEIPQHSHPVYYTETIGVASGSMTSEQTIEPVSGAAYHATGSGVGLVSLSPRHNIMQPYQVVNYIIYTGIETDTHTYMLSSGTVFEVLPTMDFGQVMLIGLMLVWFMGKIYGFVFRLVYRR